MIRTLCLIVLLATCCHYDAFAETADAGKSLADNSLAEKALANKAVPNKALDELKAKAKAGDATAQFELANQYVNGSGVPQDDKQAAHWYRQAAEQGDQYAQYNLGVLHYKGKGVEQDYPQAAMWYRKAAKQGDANAQNALAGLYYEGVGVKQDYTQAASLYTQAATQGHGDAQVSLARLYYEGTGVQQDYQQAYVWIAIAANGSDPRSDAARNRDMVASQLSPEALHAAQQEIDALMHKPVAASPPASTEQLTTVSPPLPVAQPAAAAAAPPKVAAAAVPQKIAAAVPGKQDTKADKKPAAKAAASGGWVVQVAALSSQASADAMIKKLANKGFKAFSMVRQSSKGSTVRVLIGPQADKTAASKVQHSVDKSMGIKSLVVPHNGA